jgi:hypothetical protein
MNCFKPVASPITWFQFKDNIKQPHLRRVTQDLLRLHFSTNILIHLSTKSENNPPKSQFPKYTKITQSHIIEHKLTLQNQISISLTPRYVTRF